MPGIKDNAYIILQDDTSPGRVLAGRCGRRCVEGRQLTELYALAPDELTFLEANLKVRDLIGLFCNDGAQLLLVFTYFYCAKRLLVVVEPRFSTELLLRLMGGGALPHIGLSPGLCAALPRLQRDYLALLRNDRSRATQREREALAYLEGLGSVTTVTAKSLRETVQGMAAFAGVHCLLQREEDDGRLLYRLRQQGGGLVYDREGCALLLLTVAMLAGKRARDCNLTVCTVTCQGGELLRLSFLPKGKGRRCVGCIETVSRLLSACGKASLLWEQTEEGFSLELFPFYPDEGTVGVKQDGPILWDESDR